VLLWVLPSSAQVGAGAATVLGEHALGSDSPVDEPRDGDAQNFGGGLLGLVVTGLDASHTAVVVDHGVQASGPDQGIATLAAWIVGRRRATCPALLATDVASSAAVRDASELLDGDLEHVASLLVLIAADRFACDPCRYG
jgi:hypothetical protein